MLNHEYYGIEYDIAERAVKVADADEDGKDFLYISNDVIPLGADIDEKALERELLDRGLCLLNISPRSIIVGRI